MFTEALQRGLAAGGWVIGFVTAVGIFALIAFIILQLLSSVLGEMEQNKTKGGRTK